MRTILTCVCLVLLFVSPRNATAQSMAAPDSVLPGTATSAPEPPANDFLEIAKPGDDATPLNRQEPNPMPEHTGFGTLAKDTVSDFVAFPKRKSTWVILAGGAGAIADGVDRARQLQQQRQVLAVVQLVEERLAVRLDVHHDPEDVGRLPGERVVAADPLVHRPVPIHRLRPHVRDSDHRPRVLLRRELHVVLRDSVRVAAPRAGCSASVSRVGTSVHDRDCARRVPRDRSGTPVNGIVKMKIRDLEKRSPGRVSVDVLGRNADYPLLPNAFPLSATVVLGDATASAAGLCGEGTVAQSAP